MEESITPQVLELLISELGVSPQEVIRVPGPLDLRGLHDIADLPRDDLKYPAFVPITHGKLTDVESSSPVDVFEAARRHDILLHHPYDSFATSVQRFLEQAAADPHVLAIKQTLYRTSGDSPIIDALVDAAESGKQVLALIEIKARFDESANIRWARKLEHAGCHVVYGQVGLKTHCKLAMVVRDEPDGIRRYTHIGTGNYNPKTARSYEDLGLITTDEAIGEDVANLFNNLSGYSRKPSYDQLLVAPDSVREGLIDQIHREITHHRQGKPARIRIKANSIVDEATIDALYLASQEGVPVAAAGARHLLAATRRTRPLGVDRGALDPGPVPRAQSGVLVRERRRAPGLDRVRGPDAPQPRPARRGAGPAARRREHRAGRSAAGPGVRPRHARLAAAQRRVVGAQRRQGASPGGTDREPATAAGDLTPPRAALRSDRRVAAKLRSGEPGHHDDPRSVPRQVRSAPVAFSLRPVDGAFYELFNEMALHLVGGSALLAEMLAEGTDRAAKAKEMREAESVADATTRTIIARVNKTFVTPFDREDIYALANGLDDVMDEMEEAADLINLYEIGDLPTSSPSRSRRSSVARR